MNKIILALVLALVLVFTFVAVVVLFDLPIEKVEEGKLYTFPLLVGEITYTVNVRSNYSSAPDVSYFGLDKSVLVDFRGDQENAFCNITIPIDLIWGELSVIDKYYFMSADRYIQSKNNTHNSIYFTFNNSALVKHFEVRGSEGVSS